MKKISLIAVLGLLAAMPVFTSCGDDDDDPQPVEQPAGPLVEEEEEVVEPVVPYDVLPGDYGTLDTDAYVATGEALYVGPFAATILAKYDSKLLEGENYSVGIAYSADNTNPTAYDSNERIKEVNMVAPDSLVVILNSLEKNKTYFYRTFVMISGGEYYYGEVRSFTTIDWQPSTDDELDMSLPSGLKWATMNVGATAMEGYGDYFAWGEVNPKRVYYYDNSLTYEKSAEELMALGIIDSTGNLTPAYDAATVNMGEPWRMPTKAELDELIANCYWTWIKHNGVNGYAIVSKADLQAQLFMPAAGFYFEKELKCVGHAGRWWSATAADDIQLAYGLYIFPQDNDGDDFVRSRGRTVRAVKE